METRRLLPMQPPARVRGCCQPVAPVLDDERLAALAELFKAVADPARLQLLHMLKAAATPVCVCDFTAALPLSQPTISHHLARLKDVGLVGSEKRGVWSFYTLRQDLSPAARDLLDAIP